MYIQVTKVFNFFDNIWLALNYRNEPSARNIIQAYKISFAVKTVDIAITSSGFKSDYRTTVEKSDSLYFRWPTFFFPLLWKPEIKSSC